MVVIASILAGLYGALTVFAGISQTKGKNIQYWAAISMIIAGLTIIISAVLLIVKVWLSSSLLIIGLAGIHLLAINNGLKVHGKINPTHHIARLVLSVLIAGLAIWGTR